MELKVLPSEKTQLYLLFYKPSKGDPKLNHFVAFVDSPFCHVEIAIRKSVGGGGGGDGQCDKTMLASSIYQNQTVFLKPKTYDREGYISFAIEISVAQLYRIKSFCKHHTERKTPFSLHAMYAAYLPFQIIETDGTFCSKHVTQALQYARVPLADGINPALTTPSRLYKRLVGASPIIQIVPSRMVPMGICGIANNNNAITNNNKNKSTLKKRQGGATGGGLASFWLNVFDYDTNSAAVSDSESNINNNDEDDEDDTNTTTEYVAEDSTGKIVFFRPTAKEFLGDHSKTNRNTNTNMKSKQFGITKCTNTFFPQPNSNNNTYTKLQFVI